MATVRTEYETLARDFPALAAQFGIAVDGALERELVGLMAAFETVDRHVDALDDADARVALGRAIVRAVRGEATGSAIGGELGARLGELHALLLRGDAVDRVAGGVERFFACSELLRTTTDARVFVQAVLDEAARASEMTLAVAARVATDEFAQFFALLSEVANLVDKLHDVRGDRRRGEIAVRAGTRLHARLLAAFVVRCATLLYRAPKPLRLVAWGARYLVPPKR
jgi:hypothetical protein